jgi:MFS family permease
VAIDVREVLASVRSLLGGGAAFIIGNSLLGIILPLRMEAAGYPVELIGMIMTAYYAGLAVGSLYGKRIILRVGHIRALPCSRQSPQRPRSPIRSRSRRSPGCSCASSMASASRV